MPTTQRQPAHVWVRQPIDRKLPIRPAVVTLVDTILAGQVEMIAVTWIDEQIGHQGVIWQTILRVDPAPVASAICCLINCAFAMLIATRAANARVDCIRSFRINGKGSDGSRPTVMLLLGKALAQPLPGLPPLR